MKDIIKVKSGNMAIATFSAVQTIKYILMTTDTSAVECFKRNGTLHTAINPTLVTSITTSHSRYRIELNKVKVKEEERRKAMGQQGHVLTTIARAKSIKQRAIKRAFKQRKAEEPEKYDRWQAEHKYKLNHTGNAGAMEGAGSVRIFGRSEKKLGLRFTEYLGDGDSSSFNNVQESQSYGDETSIAKLGVCRTCSEEEQSCTPLKPALQSPRQEVVEPHPQLSNPALPPQRYEKTYPSSSNDPPPPAAGPPPPTAGPPPQTNEPTPPTASFEDIYPPPLSPSSPPPSPSIRRDPPSHDESSSPPPPPLPDEEWLLPLPEDDWLPPPPDWLSDHVPSTSLLESDPATSMPQPMAGSLVPTPSASAVESSTEAVGPAETVSRSRKRQRHVDNWKSSKRLKASQHGEGYITGSTLIDFKTSFTEKQYKSVDVGPTVLTRRRQKISNFSIPVGKDDYVRMRSGLAKRIGFALAAKTDSNTSRRRNGLDESTIEAVKTFYVRADIVYTTPGMNDYITIWSNGEKTIERKYYLTMFLKEAFELFRKSHLEVEISISKFCELLPKNALLWNCLDESIIEAVKTFYVRADLVQKTKERKYYLTVFLREAFELFRKSHKYMLHSAKKGRM
ncbi:hypothetical protein EGW08_004198 [Elysia chlorotica]|uniref:Mutator-like transposase domain-containing protein n=1 Tax=Elysia chlorotica TaxID=188477 RepID=A0A3S0ZWW6_ELYCH|nr:hypothetical protein EGW08_004198 [Elysia chlorotica]